MEIKDFVCRAPFEDFMVFDSEMIKKKYETADLLHSRILVSNTNPD